MPARPSPRVLTVNLTALAVLIGCHQSAQAQISITTPNGSYTQDFNSLTTSTSSTAWANDSTLPGWFLFRQPTPGMAITTYMGGTGSSTTGSFYSFGSAAAPTDRALGGLGSGGAYFGSPAGAPASAPSLSMAIWTSATPSIAVRQFFYLN